MAAQMLYQQDLGGASVEQILRNFRPGEYHETEGDDAPSEGEGNGRSAQVGREAFLYAERLVRGSLEHREEIDELIASQAENWRLERMPAVDRNILRLAVYELLYETDVPHLVVLDEAIELAKTFGSEQSGAFINGLLDGLIRSHPLPGKLT
jgi:N utilization substance protein B